MSGTIEICTKCGGEYHSHGYEMEGYVLNGGYCANCDSVLVIVPEDALSDDDFDSDGATMEIASKIRNSNSRYRIKDSPEFQAKQVTRPTKDKYCSSCIHGRTDIKDGQFNGQACTKHPECRPRFNVHLIEDCKDYEPVDKWNGMGSECRYCHYAYRLDDGSYRCEKQGDYMAMSDYERGHCEHLITSDIWAFEKKGLVACPECHGMAYLLWNGRTKCTECGYSAKEE